MAFDARIALALDGENVLRREVRKFIGKNQQWLDGRSRLSLSQGAEPTNNKAGRALQPQVVLRNDLRSCSTIKGLPFMSAS